MNEAEKKFFYDVIKPRLVEMAIDDTLPHDMNELSIESFLSADNCKVNNEKDLTK